MRRVIHIFGVFSASLMTLVMLAACTSKPTDVGALGSSSAGPPATASPQVSTVSASPSRPDMAALKARALNATMPTTALAQIKLSRADVDQGAQLIAIDACGTNINGPASEPTGSYQRVWPGDPGTINQVVRAHADTSGASLVERATALGGGCKPYTVQGQRREPLGAVTIPAFGGVDAAYAYCEKWETTGPDVLWNCRAFLGRNVTPSQGGLITMIVSLTSLGKERCVELLMDAVAIAAPVFGKA